MLLGSEGTLGVITEAWVKVRPRPRFKASRSVLFDDFRRRRRGSPRDLPDRSQPVELPPARPARGGDDRRRRRLLGRAHPRLRVRLRARSTISSASRSSAPPTTAAGSQPAPESRDRGDEAAGTWRQAFLEAPYLRDSLISLGVLSETFETAITWDRFGEFNSQVREAARRAVAEVCDAPAAGEGSPRVSCRFTHVYPNGPAPYFTVLAPARRGSEVAQWDEIKAAVSEAIISAGGTITHHHAVGRDHRPWYDLQRPDAFAEALIAAKSAVDPAAILNPGVLIDPDPL